jgi:hypothetical protein
MIHEGLSRVEGVAAFCSKENGGEEVGGKEMAGKDICRSEFDESSEIT